MPVFHKKHLHSDLNIVTKKPLIMLIDDEIENINVLQQLLEPKFQIITGLNGLEAFNLIENMSDPKKIQLIICDQRMPELTGTEFFEKIIVKMPKTIRIILTGFSDVQAIIDSINKAKLYKFITKPFNPAELVLTVQRAIEAYQMQMQLDTYTRDLEDKIKERTEELQQKNHALNQAMSDLEKVSHSDPLTGAHNRRFLAKHMPQEMAKVRRDHYANSQKDQRDMGFLLLDVDFFKQINDTYGHNAGDRVLTQIVHILGETCRKSDWIIRWGGEEFLIVCSSLDRNKLMPLANKIRRNFESHSFDIGQDQPIKRTCSIGVIAYPFIPEASEALTWEQTLNLADLALYHGKKNGRNTCVYLQAIQVENPQGLYDKAITNMQACLESNSLAFHSQSSEGMLNT